MSGPYAYTVAQLAREWCVSSRHVYTLVAEGQLGHLRIGGLIRIRHADREAYEAQLQGSTPEAVRPTAARRKPRDAFRRGQEWAVKHGSRR